MSKPFRISTFGGLTVSFEGRDLELPASRKTRALLGYLALSARPMTRTHLCQVFWSTPDDPRGALRWAVSKLRGVLNSYGVDVVEADRETVWLNLAQVEIDLEDAKHQVLHAESGENLDQLTKLGSALSDPVMADLETAGGPDFQTWIMAQREGQRALRIQTTRHLAVHSNLGGPCRLHWAQVWVALEPLSAEATTTLIAIFRHLDRTREADQTEETFRKAAAQDGRHIPQSFAAPNHLPKPKTPAQQAVGFCTTKTNVRIAYASVGSGPPLVKAANWLNHLELDWDSPIWGPTFHALAQDHQFIRYDERGNGMSDWDVDDLSLEAFVDDLETVVDTLGLEKFPLLGISQGCAVSVAYAVRHPERVSALVLVSGYATGWRIGASLEEQERREAVMTLTRLGWGRENPAYRQIFSQTFMPDAKPEELDWFNEFQRLTTSPENAVRFQEAFGDIDVRDQLAKVQTPTIVFHSREDQRISFQQGRELAEGIPGSEFVPLESKNHILLGSEPAWHVFNSKIHDFLRRHQA